jgi:uncharacterized protein
MEFLHAFFPVSGVKTWLFIPPLVAFLVSAFTSMGGVSGAFILLPFQMSCLGFTSPAVSSTNFVYNIVAIPSGVYQYFKEGRMAWGLAWVLIAGSCPGVFIGYYLRTVCLPDPRSFKFFAGLVLLYVGSRILYDLTAKGRTAGARPAESDNPSAERKKFSGDRSISRSAPGQPSGPAVRTVTFTLKVIEYEFRGERFRFSVPAMLLLAFVVGIVGGAYGIGGGAIIAPLCVAVFRLPVYTVAGAALFGTFFTSIAGVLFYTVLSANSGVSASPDWALGSLFGIGGFAGMYIGARLQKRVPQKIIKLALGIAINVIALRYIFQYLSK